MTLYLSLLLRFLAAELPIAVPLVVLPMIFSKLKLRIRLVHADVGFILLMIIIVILGLPKMIVSLHYLGYLLIYLSFKFINVQQNIWTYRMFVLSVLFYSVNMILDNTVYVERSINYLLLTKLHLFALVVLCVKIRERPGLNLIISFIILYSLLLTHARMNAIVGIVIVLFGILRLINFKENRWLFTLILGGISYAIYFTLPYFYKLKAIDRILTDEVSGAKRFSLWESALSRTDLLTFITGHGPAASKELANSFSLPYLHNIFLEWIYDFGIFGLALCIFYLMTVIKALVVIVSFKENLGVIIAIMFILELTQFLKSFDGLQLWSLCIITSLLWKE